MRSRALGVDPARITVARSASRAVRRAGNARAATGGVRAARRRARYAKKRRTLIAAAAAFPTADTALAFTRKPDVLPRLVVVNARRRAVGASLSRRRVRCVPSLDEGSGCRTRGAGVRRATIASHVAAAEVGGDATRGSATRTTSRSGRSLPRLTRAAGELAASRPRTGQAASFTWSAVPLTSKRCRGRSGVERRDGRENFPSFRGRPLRSAAFLYLGIRQMLACASLQQRHLSSERALVLAPSQYA